MVDTPLVASWVPWLRSSPTFLVVWDYFLSLNHLPMFWVYVKCMLSSSHLPRFNAVVIIQMAPYHLNTMNLFNTATQTFRIPRKLSLL